MAEDVLDALENLRHHNAILLQEKKAIESCFEEEAIEKDRLKSTLTENTAALREMLRRLRMSNRETADSLVSLSDRLRPLGLEKLAPPASILQGVSRGLELVLRANNARPPGANGLLTCYEFPFCLTGVCDEEEG